MITPDIVTIAEGWFLMGSMEGQENEQPCHRVWIDSFGMGRFPVTNREYKRFLEAARKQPPPLFSDPIFANPDQPVVAVTWDDASAYCAWLSDQMNASFRLPTEAEWERAARDGLEAARYPWGDKPPAATFVGCSPETGGPAKIGVNAPNGFGLYDMSENVHEWCADWYDPGYYFHSPERNPPGPALGQRRVSRGGSWRHRIQYSRCAARSSLPPGFQYADYGFRIAQSVAS
jgi:formylglycine-generating enzyme required for sulfatase activity